ncbi:MAG: long-chain fatty acid--CoA ligase, partial [Actinomycetota bacterium]|nr:long-chain fatty acid--CoA ligase [Actinomycetota bacterium]
MGRRVADVVAAWAAGEPDRVALFVDGGDDLTYGVWDERSTAVARGLAARGVGPGDRVCLLFDAPRWAAFATAHLGVLKA